MGIDKSGVGGERVRIDSKWSEMEGEVSGDRQE